LARRHKSYDGAGVHQPTDSGGERAAWVRRCGRWPLFGAMARIRRCWRALVVALLGPAGPAAGWRGGGWRVAGVPLAPVWSSACAG